MTTFILPGKHFCRGAREKEIDVTAREHQEYGKVQHSQNTLSIELRERGYEEFLAFGQDED